MCDLRPASNLESDHMADFSLMNSRLDSFRGSDWSKHVSAERLARAGFYFTGHADRVRCFSCQKTVENWCTGDTPVERHKEVSPSCRFLSCTHRTNFNLSCDTRLTNGSTYNEEAEDMEYRLRTGEVVDESTYPMAPHMRSEEARLQTLSSWPSTAPVRPRDLAQAGLYYLGEGDRVQCFCCGGMLGGWEAGDTAWREHAKHFPYCFFILGHDVGNIPFLGGAEEECGSRPHANTHVSMGSLEDRLGSFAGVQHPIDHERLARAGFYSAGTGDKVLCFRCGGGVKSWQPEEDPWEEHAKHYPGCSFLLAEKGPEYVNSIQLQDPRRNRATSSQQNGFSGHGNDVLQSAMAQRAIGMGLEPSVVEKTILEKIRSTGSGYSTSEALMEDCLNTPMSDSAMSQDQDEDPLEKLRKLQREKQCKICMDRDICIVFIPCGHLVTCRECSKTLIKCPICCGAIMQKIKTYIA
ncbi:E3 ubiquitin-protein ligase XIAP [Cottoperca gobio]|uniref:E3 ubiquitin-protein ligase XIAP n=1 Tax=Cottoperca gobio TaxID=56716 RepID=A0A6J2QHB1_COTGO|nr:E3 ubiquitin-protein ligase XIAP [Cottoperca gobio]